MFNPNIFSPFFFDAGHSAGLQKKFDEGIPFRHLVIDDFLDSSFAQELLGSFPAIGSMKTQYDGLNERKAEESDFNKLDGCFTELHNVLSSAEFISWIEKITSLKPLGTVNDRLGCGLHQGGNNSFLDIHIDYNIHPIKKISRKLNLLIFLNPEWHEEWGGYLELWDGKVKNCIQKIKPSFNRAVIFECSEISYHGYSRITVPPNITRKSYYQYFFLALDQRGTYHDTIFKPKPKDKLLKRAAIPVKEFCKNSIKKILYRAGLKKFLE
ncbi:MAG: 2OG-Fe(II) oxygenase [Bacteroidetes bacterium]|nr:2OG-Fe(II) oxygenase [Bacteroidota bacterium]MBS1973555.1 2OG-Fe(II) oxygenase [Bacteroidota bacterium]